MAESVPKFRDVEPRNFKRPAFARDLDALSDDILKAIEEMPSEKSGEFSLGHRAALMKTGKPHPAIAGVSTDVDYVDLQTNYDLAADDDSLWADAKDDKLYRATDKAGALTIDVAEIVGLVLAHYAGFNVNYADVSDTDAQRDVYLTSTPTTSFLLQPVGSETTEIGPNRWKYKGHQCRMIRPPLPGDTDDGDAVGVGKVWERHPDVTEDDGVTLYTDEETNNSATAAGGTPFDTNYTAVNPIAGVVHAVRRSFPAYEDENGDPQPAGVAWWFRAKNDPVIDCTGGT